MANIVDLHTTWKCWWRIYIGKIRGKKPVEDLTNSVRPLQQIDGPIKSRLNLIVRWNVPVKAAVLVSLYSHKVIVLYPSFFGLSIK